MDNNDIVKTDFCQKKMGKKNQEKSHKNVTTRLYATRSFSLYDIH